MDDGSKRVKLKGGRHDAHRNKKKTAGFWLRIYPDARAIGYYVDKSFVVTTPASFADEFTYDGEIYRMPEKGNEATWSRDVKDEVDRQGHDAHDASPPSPRVSGVEEPPRQ